MERVGTRDVEYVVEFRRGRERSDAIVFASLNLSHPFAIRSRRARRESATTISSFVVGLVAFVSATAANVFWSAFGVHQFAARSHQN
jgi:phosphoglycerol transferase MdoB-like AlkP superfamily enzyme